MRLNTGTQWAFRIGVILFLLALAMVLNTLDLLVMLHPHGLHGEESLFWKVLEPSAIVLGFAVAIPVDLFLGRMDSTQHPRNF